MWDKGRQTRISFPFFMPVSMAVYMRVEVRYAGNCGVRKSTFALKRNISLF